MIVAIITIGNIVDLLYIDGVFTDIRYVNFASITVEKSIKYNDLAC